jgi:putative ABC transport system permease protein
VFEQALEGIRRHRLRSGLAMLGIAWGIVAVTMLMAYGDGLDRALGQAFRGAFNDGVSVVFPGRTTLQAGGERAGRPVRIRLADARALDDLSVVRAWSPEYLQDVAIAWETTQSTYRARGVAPEYALMRSQPVASGRFITPEDVQLRRRVVFLGSAVALRMFGRVPPVGETVRINGQPFQVVGVQGEKVQLSNYGRPDKESVFIPYTTAGQLWNTEYMNALVYEAANPALDGETTAEVRSVLSRRLRVNAADDRVLEVRGSADSRRLTSTIVLGLKLLLFFTGLLTLAVGGVGIMNVMLISVSERTSEIGLRKALGARRRDILLQFLFEGLATTFAGGAAGALIAAAAVRLATPQPFVSELLGDPTGSADIHLRVSLQLIGVCCLVLTSIGLVSSLIPAIRAARLDPAVALRQP